MAQSYHSTAFPMPVPTSVRTCDLWTLTSADVPTVVVMWFSKGVGRLVAGEGCDAGHGEFCIQRSAVGEDAVVERGVRRVVEGRRRVVGAGGDGAEPHEGSRDLGEDAG